VSGWREIFNFWTQLKFIINKLISVLTFLALQAFFKQLVKLLNRVRTILKFSLCRGLYNSYLCWQCRIGMSEEKADFSNEGCSVL
jgi:hypothetical protein